MNKLYEKHNYLNKNIEHIKSGIITEYDMKNAGIEILLANNFITKDKYNSLMELPKLDRSILVGKFLKTNQDANSFLMEEFVRIRQELFEINNLEDYDILSIKKDAVFLINKKLMVSKLEKGYLFTKRNEYTNYLYLNKKEHYYNSSTNLLDVKGYNEKVLIKEKDFFFKTLKEIMFFDYYNKKDDLFLYLIKFKDDYLIRNLDKEYYFDLNKAVYEFIINEKSFYLDDINNKLKTQVNIIPNLQFILEIINKVL